MYTTLKEVLKEAEDLNMAIGAFNTHNLEMLPSIIKAAVNQRTPVIIQTSCGTANYIGHKNLVSVCKSMAEQYGIDVVLHLDHAKDYDEIRKAIDAGYSSVMFDGSSLPLKDNILGTKRVVEYAKKNGVSVEAELGHVGQSEDYSSDVSDHFTKPEEVKKFVEETGIDCLAVAIGTAHGRYHGTPHIDFDLLKQITDVVDIPLVLHGGSGTGDENLRKAVKNGIQKVNLATELVVAGKEELETFIQDKNFDKWQLIPSFIKGYSDRLEHYVNLFDQENRAW